MPEPKSEIAPVVPETLAPIALSSNTLAHDLMATILAELRGMPDHYSRISPDLQQRTIDAMKDRVKSAVDTAVGILARGTYPAIPATLDFVSNRKGITAGLSISKDAICRHELFDSQGQRVLVVIADPARWMEKIDEIKAKASQADLFDPEANYDPTQDNSKYRKDQDQFAPAGKTWADLKKSFAAPSDLPASSDPAADKKAQDILVQDRLTDIGCVVTLEEIAAWTPEQLDAAGTWADEFQKQGDGCTIPRPDFLPPLQNTPDKGDE